MNAPQTTGPRYALVIGNADYKNIDKLVNTINDARDIAAALEKLGFDVDLKLNVGRLQFGNAVDGYVKKLGSDSDSEGFFWYAGHGVQIGDQNYLLPVDAALESERVLQRDSYSLDGLLADFENAGNKVNVVVLDACRNNPLPSSSRGAGTRGLAAIQDVPGDQFVMFSTAPGDVAADGKGKRNSPFAEAFLKHIDSHQPLVIMSAYVANETMARTANAQRPFSRGSIISDALYSLNPDRQAAYTSEPETAHTEPETAHTEPETAYTGRPKTAYVSEPETTPLNNVPSFVKEAYNGAPKDVLIGIGTYNTGGDPSKVGRGKTFAEMRARADISRQLQILVNNIATDFISTSKIDPRLVLSFYEDISKTLSNSNFRGARTIYIGHDDNGLLWAVLDYGKSLAVSEVNKAVDAAKLNVPTAAVFNMIDRMDAIFNKEAAGGPIPVHE
jgi:hypothetical protein